MTFSQLTLACHKKGKLSDKTLSNWVICMMSFPVLSFKFNEHKNVMWCNHQICTHFNILIKVYIYIYIYYSAVKQLIASKIKVFVYIIYVYLLCIYKYKHMHIYI